MDPGLLQALRAAAPKCFNANGTFLYDSGMGMEALGRVVYILCTYGFIPRTGLGPRYNLRKMYGLHIWHKNDIDFASQAHELIVLASQEVSRVMELNPGQSDGIALVVAKSDARPRITSCENRVFICSAMKSIIVKECFSGIKYRPVCAYNAPVDDNNELNLEHIEVCEEWWELDTDIVMPSVSSLLVDDEGIPYKEGQPFSRVLRPYNGFIVCPDVHYRRSDLVPLGDFDLARAKEIFGRPPRALIASRRLAKFFIDNGCKIVPHNVVIDDQ